VGPQGRETVFFSSKQKHYNPSTNFSRVSPVASPIPKSLFRPTLLGVLSCGSMALCSGVPKCPCSMDPDNGLPSTGWGEPECGGCGCCGEGWFWTCGEGLECGRCCCCEGGQGDWTGAGDRTWLLRVFASVGWPGRWAPPWGWTASRWVWGLMGLGRVGVPICCLRMACCCCWSIR